MAREPLSDHLYNHMIMCSKIQFRIALICFVNIVYKHEHIISSIQVNKYTDVHTVKCVAEKSNGLVNIYGKYMRSVYCPF